MEVTRKAAVETVQAGLVRSVRGILTGDACPDRAARRIADVLTLFLGHPDLLLPQQRLADPQKYRQHLLHVEEDGSFSLSALVWLPGQKTSIHDHVCWGVVGIHQGSLREEEYRLEEDGGERFLVPGRSVACRFGDVTSVTPPGDIHLLVNSSPEVAISIHIYGTDVRKLGTSIREKYELPVCVEAAVA
jgi:predicted metal-dependent enzyme (double-stranded beta helix superfamily)